MGEVINLINDIDIQSKDLNEELLSLILNCVYDFNYLIKFYIQLSFSPSKFTKVIETVSNKISTAFNEKLIEMHVYHSFTLELDDFISYINTIVYASLYKIVFIQSMIGKEEIINECKRALLNLKLF